MCLPTTTSAANSRWCLEDKSCSLIYSPGKLLALFFVETGPNTKDLVIQNEFNMHYGSSTCLFRIKLMLVDWDPDQVSPESVEQ